MFTAGLPEASVLGIAKALVNTGLVSDPIVQAVVRYSDFLTDLKSEFGDLFDTKVSTLPNNAMISLGDFNLSPNGDLRSLTAAGDVASGGDLSALVPYATKIATNLQGQLDSLAAQFPASADYLSGLKAAVNRLQTEISLTYPFTDDPVNGAFAMLMGRDAVLVQFNFSLPSIFNVQLANLMNEFGAPVLGSEDGLPASARLDGTLNIDMDLSGGYDTHGLRRLLSGEGDATILADGFFLDSSKPIFAANGNFSIAAGPQLGGTVDTPLGKYGAEVGIEGRGDFDFHDLSVSFDDPNLDGDNRFRPFYSDAGRNLFTASGSLSGSLSIDAYAELDGGILGSSRFILASFTPVSGTILDFGGPSYTKTNPVPAGRRSAHMTYSQVYDFAADRPDLANDGTPDVLYASVKNDAVQIYEASSSLAEWERPRAGAERPGVVPDP